MPPLASFHHRNHHNLPSFPKSPWPASPSNPITSTAVDEPLVRFAVVALFSQPCNNFDRRCPELANEFCIVDKWFALVPASTQPNRFYVHLATSHDAMSNIRRDLIHGFPQ